MMIYKVLCHGRAKDYVVMAKSPNKAVEIVRRDLVTNTNIRESIHEETIERCNVVKIGVVTADIDHTYKEECIILKG